MSVSCQCSHWEWVFEFAHSSQNQSFTETDYIFAKPTVELSNLRFLWLSQPYGDIHMLPGRQVQS